MSNRMCIIESVTEMCWASQNSHSVEVVVVVCRQGNVLFNCTRNRNHLGESLYYQSNGNQDVEFFS